MKTILQQKVPWWETQQHQALHCYFTCAVICNINVNTKITLIIETWRFAMATSFSCKLGCRLPTNCHSHMSTFWIMFLCSFFICKKVQFSPSMTVNLELLPQILNRYRSSERTSTGAQVWCSPKPPTRNYASWFIVELDPVRICLQISFKYTKVFFFFLFWYCEHEQGSL